MHIITIGREFGSGGRELGKRLADELGYDYYDREIIDSIAEKHEMSSDYVEKTLEGGNWSKFTFTFGHSFYAYDALQSVKSKLVNEERKILEEIAKRGRDCVIVGRNADVTLAEYEPFNIFVCADMDARIERCRSRASSDENMTDKQMEKNIRSIDKNRADSRSFITDRKWGDKNSYNLIVNTTGREIKKITPAVAEYINCWYK